MDQNGLLVISNNREEYFAIPVSRFISVVSEKLDQPDDKGNNWQVTVNYYNASTIVNYTLNFFSEWDMERDLQSLRKNYSMALQNRY